MHSRVSFSIRCGHPTPTGGTSRAWATPLSNKELPWRVPSSFTPGCLQEHACCCENVDKWKISYLNLTFYLIDKLILSFLINDLTHTASLRIWIYSSTLMSSIGLFSASAYWIWSSMLFLCYFAILLWSEVIRVALKLLELKVTPKSSLVICKSCLRFGSMSSSISFMLKFKCLT